MEQRTRRFQIVGMGGDADACDDFPAQAEWMVAADGSWSVAISEIGGGRRAELIGDDPRCAEMIRFLLDRMTAARPIVPAVAASAVGMIALAHVLIALVDYWMRV